MTRSRLSVLTILISTAALACTGKEIIAPETGNLRVITSTEGAEADAQYTVRLNTGESQDIQASGTVTFTALTPVNHSVELADIAPNCSIGGENPRVVEVQPNQTAEVAFSVTCDSTTGSIVVRSLTSGPFPDPDGYTVTVNGATAANIDALDTSEYVGLTPASYLVQISGIASNCRLVDGSSRIVPVSAAASAVVEFVVDCSSPPPIAFIHSPNVRGIISLVNADGSGLTRLSNLQRRLHRPVWSPDRSKIAFVVEHLYIMNPDGTDLTRLTMDLLISDGSFGRSRWAPDGSTIAVTVNDCPNLEICGSHVWLARTDGSGATLLAQGWWPSWSPDGRTILFFNDQGAFTVSPDGSGLTRLDAPARAVYGVWSPDGARIALMAGVSDGSNASEVFVMNRDGSGLMKLTQEGWDETEPVWSPDGSRIAIQTRPRDAPYGVGEIDIVMADGSGRRRLTGDPLMDYSPAWSPDGSQIAFVKLSTNPLNEEVYVISADGGVPVNVSNDPLESDAYPSWSE
jgi:Tol biopolymer transport system component